MSRLIIRRLRQAHCKKGPESCEECRRTAEQPGKACLLELFTPGGSVQRRIIELPSPTTGDGSEWFEYDIVRVFATEAEAVSFAEENRIDDVDLRI